ncbi:MAG: alpha-galactosidase [Lachnospiraceae bacterium]|nr:alpha-galactosidase [Lachnospiraceae bacterium]
MERPVIINDPKYRYDNFTDGKTFPGKKTGRLPMMGWNSWNAFGSGNSEALTKAMADCIKELGLDDLGYKYLVLDDGCYKNERVNGLLANEEVKFPSGFRALADYIHSKGLKFGMYNDIGSNLCAGAAVGTCGHEKEDAKSYTEWDVDFIKVDNCYYLWDNATFSNAENARYTYAPGIASVRIEGNGIRREFSAVTDGKITGNGPEIREGAYVANIGTFDGTGPDVSPVGMLSGELTFDTSDLPEGDYSVYVTYTTGRESGLGEWLQIAAGSGDNAAYFYDDFLPESPNGEFTASDAIAVSLNNDTDVIRFMNHRRQENTLCSYAALLQGFLEADPDTGIVMSLCEWGKTQPHNWGYKVGDSWRILNDITFQVGSDGNPGRGSWASDYTPGVAVQYDKAVIMDEFAGLSKGWNDPDMLMIGMDGLDMDMCRTHFSMWCMMNSPLMLGLDLRRVKKGDELYNIIANKELIALNQDALGIQAKRVYTSAGSGHPDTEYIRDNDRIDILAKPLSDGSLALAFFNLSEHEWNEDITIDMDRVLEYIGSKLTNRDAFCAAGKFTVKDLWNRSENVSDGKTIHAGSLAAHADAVFKITPAV